MGRFDRSMLLLKSAWSVLKENKKLMLLPAISFLVSIIVLGSYLTGFAVFYIYTLVDHVNLSPSTEKIIAGIFGFIFYLTANLIIIFFNSVLVLAVNNRLNHREASLGVAFRMAFSKFGLIFKWSLISATIGLVLRHIEERVGIIGQWIINFIGLAWTVVSYFAIPVMVIENKGPFDALKESAQILKKTFGESLMGFGGISLIFILAYLLLGCILTFSFTFWQDPEFGLLAKMGSIIATLTLLIMILLHSTLVTIFRVAIYRYASSGNTLGNFTPELIESCVIKRRR